MSSSAADFVEASARQVVRLAFFDVKYSGERNYPYTKRGQPILVLELLGDRHTLHTAAELLFEHHLADVLDEELYSHIWR